MHDRINTFVLLGFKLAQFKPSPEVQYTVYLFLYPRLLNEVGSGAFGVVRRGIWSVGGEEREVAVKSLADGSTEEKRIRFLQEAAIMGQFKHPNVVTLHGVVMEKEPVIDKIITVCLSVTHDMKIVIWQLDSLMDHVNVNIRIPQPRRIIVITTRAKRSTVYSKPLSGCDFYHRICKLMIPGGTNYTLPVGREDLQRASPGAFILPLIYMAYFLCLCTKRWACAIKL